MLKHILLLTPIYVTIFWSINLNTGFNKKSYPRLFLGKFMIFASLIYISHLIYFLPSPDLYLYIDPVYQYASLMVFPLYYIYFRLLTLEEKFSFKKHFRFIFVPTLLFILYLCGYVLTPTENLKVWIFERESATGLASINYLKIINTIIKFTFLIQVILSVIGNNRLIRKHGNKALQYYSDMDDSSTFKVRLLNTSMIITGVASIVLGALGRDYFENEITGIGIASVVFSSMLFIIGWLGDKQKTLNPTYETILRESAGSENTDMSAISQSKLLEKILILFNEQKIYLDATLTIQDIAQSVGTNRTYVSTIINQNFNQNFCTFVNNYRVDALEKIILNHPEYTNQLLAESCGFGSVDSLKRAVTAKTNKTITKWKEEILQKSKTT